MKVKNQSKVFKVGGFRCEVWEIRHGQWAVDFEECEDIRTFFADDLQDAMDTARDIYWGC